MLEAVDPLVADLLAKWDARPPKVNVGSWEAWFQRLLDLVKSEGRLPKCDPKSAEKRLYEWFNRQLRRLEQLPNELVDQLRGSHRVIAAAVDLKQEQERVAQKA